jgi:hypothetical protein
MESITATAQMETLAARLLRLEDERDIRGVTDRYCFAIDYGDETSLVDCFTDDARFEIRVHAPGAALPATDGVAPPDRVTVHQGRAELAAFAAGHSRPPQAYHKHVVTNLAIEQADGADTALARSTFFRFDDVGGKREIYAFGRYVDQLQRCADGKWRFRIRLVELDSPAVREGEDLAARARFRASRTEV